MKSNRVPLTSRPPLRTIGIAALAVAALTGLTMSTSAQNYLQMDNFDNNPTLTGWATTATTNYPASFTFVTDMYGGKALRMTANSVGSVMLADAATNTMFDGTLRDTARVMLWMTNYTYSTNFYIAVDLVNWNTSPDRSTNDPVIGIIAHATNVVRTGYGNNTPPTDVPGAVGQPDGVVFCTRYNADGGNDTNNGTRGQLEMYGVHSGTVMSILAATCQGDYTYTPGHKYRLIFTGTNLWDPVSLSYTNQTYWGRVYDLQDLTRPLSTIYTYETLWPFYSGTCDGCNFPKSGYSGVFAMGYNANQGGSWTPMTCDITIDNFVAANDPPPWLSLPATPYGLYGPSGVPVPQVVNRQPASWSNFYAPAGGITFNATTFTNNNVTSISLFVNGVNVTSSLTISGPTTNRSVSYFGLTSNTVYDASIVLADALGRNTTNVWTFDTFTDAFLASAVCKNIECEDFDFNGSFIDNPVASGYTWQQTSNNVLNNVPFPWPSALNQGPTGYVNQPGVNANTNGGVGDFFCFNNGNSTGAADYRPLGSIGTEAGVAEALCFSPANGGSYGVVITLDTQRQKYSSVDPNLEEYFVADTQGGEWNNYTRTFDGTKYYNVYLREGCELSQQLSLDVIGAGPTTNHLGMFYTTGAFGKSNIRYAPLLNGSGNLAVVNLSGVNTVRLTVAEPQYEKYKEGLSLNYMAFVPALVVFSSSHSKTGYAFDTTASINTYTQTITIPQNGSVRFYRLLWTRAVRITSTTVAGGNIVMTYQ